MDITQDLNDHPTLLQYQTESQIQRFYDGKRIFLTGGTGFLGKLMVEKLLRSTNVAAIYFLIRSKKGKSVHTRLDEYFDDIVFQRLKNEAPKFKHKIVGIPGDCSLAGLGMSIEDRELIIKNVNIVFHVAATVNFNEKLKLAYAINVKGAEAVLNLCREIENLKALVHVSTFYSQCHLKEIDEVFYETPVNYNDLGAILDKLDEASINRMTPKLIGNSPNTYTFTKALAETMIKERGSGLPIGVFRPAIVISTYKEPIEAWIDNMYGPTGICAGSATGLVRTMQMKTDAIANLVPADTVVAGLISAAWDVATRTCERIPSNIPIYNYGSTTENPITWGEFHLLNRLWGEIYPVSTAWWCIRFDAAESNIGYTMKKILYHTLPATVLDILSLCSGRKPQIVKFYSKIHKFSNIISYFATKDWKCSSNNVIKLWNKLNMADKELFPFSMTTVHWTTYFKKYFLGVRLYLLKDSNQTITKAKQRSNRFIILHNILKYALFFMFSQVLWHCLFKQLAKVGPKFELL